MADPVGFILLTHRNPDQAQRLVNTLNAMFDAPPIVWHHDFSQCALPTADLPENVRFVRPHLRTGWGEFSVVEATVRALEQMYDGPRNPEWFVVLSGADYPIKPAARILADLADSQYDAHLHFERIGGGGAQTEWQERCYQRYCTVRLFRFPFPTRQLSVRIRDFRVARPALIRRFLPFAESLKCYAGSQWFCGRRVAAQHIVKFHYSHAGMRAHYSRLKFAEESYFQTILANADGLRLSSDYLRYIDWSAREPHPKTLGMEDLPHMLASPAHFARKFDIDHDAAVLDALDRAIVSA